MLSLHAEEVSFHYPQEQRGMAAQSISLMPGESLLVSGPSGCGKSTLARCLAGLIPHLYRGEFKGSVLLGDLSTDITPLWKLSEVAGIVFQNPALQMLTSTVEEEILFGLENLGLPRSEMGVRLDDSLLRFNLDALRGRNPHSLSGGEQQKLALAAIFARQTPILILDEPLSMLDTTSALEFTAYLETLMEQGRTIVACEHRRDYFLHLPHFKELALSNDSSGAMASGSDIPFPIAVGSIHGITVGGLKLTLGGKTIQENLNFNLPGGKITALVGRNGSGKTTIFRALAGLQSYEGKISLVGSSLPPHMGIVFQNPDLQLFNATVKEEILYRLARPDLALYGWLLAMLDLQRYENTPPLLLSEGEKRRVALATLLMRLPLDGILLDEPAVGQDLEHKAILVRLLRALAGQGVVVAFSTHDLELAAQADQVLLLGKEGILAQGTPAQIFADSAAWQRTGLVIPSWMRLPCQ